MMYLTNEHLPEEILKQPELVLNSPAVQLARPFLNRPAATGISEAELQSLMKFRCASGLLSERRPRFPNEAVMEQHRNTSHSVDCWEATVFVMLCP